MVMLVASPSFAQKVYKKTDPSGTPIYSDAPMEDSQEIIIPEAQTYSSKPYQDAIDELSSQSSKSEKKAPQSYKLAILAPNQDQTIGKDMETVEVKLLVEPELQADHLVQLHVNDSPYQSPQKETTITMTNLYRGTYKIKAVIIDAKKKGKILKESETIQIHVQRAKVSANNPLRQINPEKPVEVYRKLGQNNQ